MVAVSQSGETADTLIVLGKIRKKSTKNFRNTAKTQSAIEPNILTLGIVNVIGLTIVLETDAGIYNHALLIQSSLSSHF